MKITLNITIYLKKIFYKFRHFSSRHFSVEYFVQHTFWVVDILCLDILNVYVSYCTVRLFLTACVFPKIIDFPKRHTFATPYLMTDYLSQILCNINETRSD